ncbi:AfsR/SARP family transcriptional regulator [Amycolatopsis eburnea]|uniref:Tetratricopeptide repeat protein n=1 Tax=Amycolatopsis eburnea TaxID=2267691 RepID=A0A3R9ENF9_9PSEU|nr:BTAD domain-containing putative transcriptional regulator [Amycolatopsis eburnea]RSD13995.1 tetratricopeptide repeat protein [Amycolatopsis eburnea]
MTADEVSYRAAPVRTRPAPVLTLPAFTDLKYRLLGPVSAVGVDGPARLGGPKQRTVLAALLLNANQVVSEDQLIELLWEDRPPASARGQLQVRVWELRKLLGREVIVRREPGYLIEVGPGELDTELFDDVAKDARRLIEGGEPRRGVERLRAVLELWQGPPLGGVTDVLVRRSGQILAEQRMTALEVLFDAELATGRHTHVVRELRHFVDEYPFGERLQEQLMLALQRSGRTPEALEVYTATRERLDAELGVEPGERLRAMHLQVLKGEADEPPEPPAPVGEVVVPARPAELPRDVRGFAGRTEQLAQLDRQLAARAGAYASDVWIVHGIPGVGKTALALHWAHRVRERFPDGQLYVNLRGFDADREPMEPAVALAQLLRALGADPRRIPEEVDAQAGLYRSLLADRQVLLVLDNARDAEQVLPLLPPTGTVLITSRHRLGRLVAEFGAFSLGLGALTESDSRALLGGVLGEGRVAAEPAAAGELAELCGHLPLALRIAAANIATGPDTTVAAMAADLAKGDRLKQLVVDGSDESAVTRAFAVSYEALAPELRRLFRLLGLASCPDFTARGAAALTGDPVDAVTRQLRLLAAAHLVEQHVAGRYRLHDLLRAYALRQAGAHEAPAARARAWRRFVELYLSGADAAERIFGRRHDPRLPREPAVVPANPISFADSAEAAAWLDAEHENLCAVVTQAVTDGPYPIAWYLADAVRSAFYHRGRRVEWVDIATTVLAAARRLDVPAVEAVTAQSIGLAFVHRERHEQAVEWMTEALRVFERVDWPEGKAAALNASAIALRVAGRFEEAAAQFELALDLQRQCGYRLGQVSVLNNLASVHRQRCLLDAARACLDEALELAVAEGYQLGEAVVLVGIGVVQRLQGDLPGARRSLTRAFDLHKAHSHPYGQGSALCGLSLVSIDLGEYEQGRAQAVQGLEIARQEQNRETEVGALNALAKAEAALGETCSAVRHQREAVAVARHWGSPWHVAEALSGMASVHGARGDHEEVLLVGAEALELARGGGLRLIEVRCLLALAGAHAGQGRREEARRLCQEGLAHATGLPTLQTRAREVLSRL